MLNTYIQQEFKKKEKKKASQSHSANVQFARINIEKFSGDQCVDL